MYFIRTAIIIFSMGLFNPSFALELYEDSVTNQVFTKPGANRVKLGEFEKIDGSVAAKSHDDNIKDRVTPQINAARANEAHQIVEYKADQAAGKNEEIIKSKDKGSLPAGVTYGKKALSLKPKITGLPLRYRTGFNFALQRRLIVIPEVSVNWNRIPVPS